MNLFGINSIIDKHNDLDGKPIAENANLMYKIRAKYQHDKRITIPEFAEFNILPTASQMKFDNVVLDKMLFTNYYSIGLINSDKTIDNKWSDSAVNMNRVKDSLMGFHYNDRLLKLKETDLNKELLEYLRKDFENVKKSATSNKGLLDLIIGNEKNVIAIEIKLSRELRSASTSQKCRGQIEDYAKQFGSNLLLVVFGEKSDKQEPNVRACEIRAKELKIEYLFVEHRK